MEIQVPTRLVWRKELPTEVLERYLCKRERCALCSCAIASRDRERQTEIWIVVLLVLFITGIGVGCAFLGQAAIAMVLCGHTVGVVTNGILASQKKP